MNGADAVKQIHIRHLDKLFIAGAWVAPSSDGKIDVVSPVTEEVVFRVAEAREPDMDRAVDAARRAFDSGPCDLPLTFHPAAIRASVVDTPFGAG